jgi:hypothetical protein
MMIDARGVPVSYGDATALERCDAALLKLHRFSYDPSPDIESIIADYPDFAMAPIFYAVCIAGSSTARYNPDMESLISQAQSIGGLNEREQGLVSAVQKRCAGDWRGAQLVIDAALADYPHDTLALYLGHQLDFLLGDALNLRGRVERILPHWDESIPNYSHVLGMHAFGLEECNMYDHAEAVGKEACERDAEDGWAHHAVGHVLEMTGRDEDGIRWYGTRKEHWATGDGISLHNWWHFCVYLMEAENYPRVFEVYDDFIAPDGTTEPEALADSNSLLWRLMIQGVDVGDRWDANGDRWRQLIAEGEGGFYGFNDLHAAMAFAALGWTGDLADLKERAENQAQKSHTLGVISREVSVPVVKAIMAFQEERYSDSLDLLEAVRPFVVRFGGSNAQRDVIDQTMLAAAIRGGLGNRAVVLSNERQSRKPNSPLARRFADKALAMG